MVIEGKSKMIDHVSSLFIIEAKVLDFYGGAFGFFHGDALET